MEPGLPGRIREEEKSNPERGVSTVQRQGNDPFMFHRVEEKSRDLNKLFCS